MTGPNIDPRPAVVLLSGGLDSATVLAVARHKGFECHSLAFDYGQRHQDELDFAARISESFGAVSHEVVTLDVRMFGGSSLTSKSEMPKGRTHSEILATIPSTYVPARNLVFLSMAVAYAETLGAQDIFIGVNAIDYSGYPDCRSDFIEAFQIAANRGTRAGVIGHGFTVHAPLCEMSKAEIIKLGTKLGVDYSLTHSCYDPIIRGDQVLACGHCDACIIRREGFRAATVADPTQYA